MIRLTTTGIDAITGFHLLFICFFQKGKKGLGMSLIMITIAFQSINFFDEIFLIFNK